MSRSLLLTGFLLLLLVGCGPEPEPPPAKPAAKKKEARPVEPTKVELAPIEVTADEFASVEECLAELERATAIEDSGEQNRAMIRCQKWLILQQDQAVPSVAARAADPQQPLGLRLMACRFLGQLGPAGIDPLLELAEKGDPNQLRRKAIETLGLVKPPQPKITDKLIALLDDPDTQIKWQVIDCLIKIGEPAKAAAGKLSELRMNHPEEQIRVSAGEALKKVDPRRKLVE